MPLAEKSVPRDLQNLNCLLSRDGGEILEEIVHAVSGLQVVEEGLDGHASSGEYRRSSEDVRR